MNSTLCKLGRQGNEEVPSRGQPAGSERLEADGGEGRQLGTQMGTQLGTRAEYPYIVHLYE